MNKPLPWADIHTHTHASDGTLSPEALVGLAKEKGLQGLSITDHDTIAAYASAIPAAQRAGIVLGIGIEFSCVFEEHDVHLLGYDFDLESIEIQELCMRHQTRRQERNQRIIEKLQAQQMNISMEDIHSTGHSVGRPHIAAALLKKGYVKSIKEAFHLFLGEGKCCYAKGEILSVDATIEVLHAAGGKAFLAHPHLLRSSFPLDIFLQMPLDGIECGYGNFLLPVSRKWEKIAEANQWLKSGGSDFHGWVKPEVRLGCQGVTKETFYQIFEKIA